MTCPQASSLEEETVELGLDSLDTLMLSVYLADIFGIPEEKLKELRPLEVENPDGTRSRSMTIKRIFDFVDQNKTADPISIEEAIAKIK